MDSQQRIRAIPTRYNGVEFRSKLEAQFAVLFDGLNARWEYEPEGFDLGDKVWYLPDFRIRDAKWTHGVWKTNHYDYYTTKEDLFVEVKGVMTPLDYKKVSHWLYGDDETARQTYNDWEGAYEHLRECGEMPSKGPIRRLLLLDKIPRGSDFAELAWSVEKRSVDYGRQRFERYYQLFYEFATLDGCYDICMPVIDVKGDFCLANVSRFCLMEAELDYAIDNEYTPERKYYPENKDWVMKLFKDESACDVDFDRTYEAYNRAYNYKFDRRSQR